MSQKDNHPTSLNLLSNYLHEIAGSGVKDILLSDAALDKLSNLSRSGSGENSSNQDKTIALSELQGKVENCKEYRSIETLRNTMVFATGSPDARIMFIGEAPGAEEEKHREPFVGPAGKLLTKIIETMGMARENVYISNIVKFRPLIDGAEQGAKNRKPSTEEIEASLPFINTEIKIVNPELIIALGGTAMTGLLGIETGVNAARGQLHELGQHQVIVTYHPSFLLRSGSNSDKRKLWEDMMMAMNYLRMPISEKQKTYFSAQ